MKLLLTIVAVAIVGISGLLLFNDVAEAAPHCKVDKTSHLARCPHQTRWQCGQAQPYELSRPAAQCFRQRL